ncbi:hypothetical protein GWK47_023255 [Chionoecetes opilio]|uniref:HAT C-terminal dimerisation domain-containing protein n=1 Tax=Chionoecetes opilio TaxID=41210 RepID=A0A8J4XM95_CHIOP|nr:hypothetical protein GWK47_023255 [Chionoecetes opilio]
MTAPIRAIIIISHYLHKAQVQHSSHLAGLRVPWRRLERATRTVASGDLLLEAPRTHTVMGQRAFTWATATLWNTFTVEVDVVAMNTQQALMSPGPTATEGTNSTRLSNKMGKELESWCSEKQWNKLLEQAMFPALSHAAWVDVFVRYNTAIPSSAAVEGLFSQGSEIMKAKRACLTSDNFERLVGFHEGEHGPAQG